MGRKAGAPTRPLRSCPHSKEVKRGYLAAVVSGLVIAVGILLGAAPQGPLLAGATPPIILPASEGVISSIPVGVGPSGLAYDSGLGEIFVANVLSQDLSVISDSTNTVDATIGAPGVDPPSRTTTVWARSSSRSPA